MYKFASASLTLAVVVGLASVACDRSSPDADQRPVAEAPGASKAPVSDAWITTKIEAQYFADADVKGRQIDVTTTNGIVLLDGRVDTERARQRAVEIAQKTDGVAQVDDSLEVSPAPSVASADLKERASSGWITTKIEAQYFADPHVEGRHIDVTTANGAVTLSGTVDGEASRQRAVEIARRTDGVRDVQDRLRIETTDQPRADSIRPGTDPEVGDEELIDRIEAKYYSDEDVGDNDIDVNAKDGVVTLSGSVDTEGERRRAVVVAKRTAGVRGVNDDLQVDSAVATSGRTGKAADLGDQVDDAWITAKIQSKFFVDDEIEGDIDVTTNKGVVTLSGAAEDAVARRQAEAIARETDGVTRVVNRLKVVPQTR